MARGADQHQNPQSDIEIAQAATMRPIGEIAGKLGIPDEALSRRTAATRRRSTLDYVAPLKDRPNGKLILVTAITPTPAGEGKTTTTVGLGDALNHIGKKAIICLREPSLGPSFGMKGGAAGGGYAQVVPMEDINLHFTGDFHAIGAANNLLGGDGRQPRLLGQRARHRPAPHHLAARPRHERPGAALDRQLARRGRERLPARGRVRHRRRLRGHGDLLPGQRPRRSEAAARQHHRRRRPGRASWCAPSRSRRPARWRCC